MSSGGKVVLTSGDGDDFEVERTVIEMSGLLKSIIADTGCEQPIPLPNVSTPILRTILTYCEKFAGNPPPEIPKPLKTANLAEVVSDWEYEYISVEHATVHELLLAANYLDIKPLLDLACAKIASMLKGKTPEEIRAEFNIENDFTPEEEEKVRQENSWCAGL